ncbi:MAG: transcription antitermination factor NusB [Coriobacteriia bacterium]|nr:transcription antitermination factor NusB [Coriobacteriia bacterium]
MSASEERLLARQVVSRVRERSAYAHETLDALLARKEVSRTSRAFITRLAYGTISCRGTVDAAVADHLAADVRLESVVSDCLALSAYEILFMRTPARAAVNEGVELVKAVSPRAGSLANAVLRRLTERADAFPWGDPDTDLAVLARLHGHPEWMAQMLSDELGRDAAAGVMAANNEPAPLFLAHMPFRSEFDEVMAELDRADCGPHAVGPQGCIRCDVAASALSSSVLSAGRAIAMDGGAQVAGTVVPLSPGCSVIDIGAGRGGKSLLIAARAHRAGHEAGITALDNHEFKLNALQDSVSQVGAQGIVALLGDASDPSTVGIAPESADAVLVDAPCSGLGTMRRHPDRRWRARPEEIEALAALDAKLLRTAASLVKPGGFVVYSTCTVVRRENEQVIGAFLASNEGSGFRLDQLGESEIPAEWNHFLSAEGWFQSLPEPGGPDGHFVARLVRLS